MKDYLLEQLRADEARYDKWKGGKGRKTIQGMGDAIKDPTVKVIPLEQTITGTRMKIIQVGLRIMESEQVPSAIAEEYARAFGHAGNVAFRIEEYDQRLRRKWGAATEFFTEQRFLKFIAERDRGRGIIPATGNVVIDMQLIRKVNLLRATCRGCEMFDLPAEEVQHAMKHFGRSGQIAYDLEDYTARNLSRREMNRRPGS